MVKSISRDAAGADDDDDHDHDHDYKAIILI